MALTRSMIYAAIVVFVAGAGASLAQQPSDASFEAFLRQSEQADIAFTNGSPAAWSALLATEHPIALLGGAGGFETTLPGIAQRTEQITSLYRNGQVQFDYVTKGVSGDIAYTVATERRKIDIGGAPTESSLRVTNIYRREGGQWKLVVRHADPLVTFQPPTAATFQADSARPDHR
jgi:hypothetical protein